MRLRLCLFGTCCTCCTPVSLSMALSLFVCSHLGSTGIFTHNYSEGRDDPVRFLSTLKLSLFVCVCVCVCLENMRFDPV